jgi:aminoglycoside phosphotransferase (APT) family kinase protein
VPIHLIPDSRQAGVGRALTEVFGTPDFEDIRPLTGGLSTALVFRVVVRGQPYLLRLIMPGAPGSDPTRWFASMRTAADAGVAPRVLYTSVDDRLVLTDFVERQGFPDDIAIRVAPMLRRLHSLQGFPAPASVNYLEGMDGLVRRFQAARLLPDHITGDFFRGYAEAIGAYPRHDTLVACHNDVKPTNILFDGTRAWLIDWEASFLNDRYIDLAWPATFFVEDDATEDAYLGAYFGKPVDEYIRSRFLVMRHLLHVFAAALVLQAVARTGTSIDASMEVQEYWPFHRSLIDRTITLTDVESKRDYGLVHFHRALQQGRSEWFKEAVTTLRRSGQ